MDELEALWGKKWGAQGLGKLKEVVMCPLSENKTRDVFWKDQEASGCQWILGKPDLKRWIEQYEGLVKVYRDNGVIVHEYEVPNPVMGPYGFTRSIFVATIFFKPNMC